MQHNDHILKMILQVYKCLNKMEEAKPTMKPRENIWITQELPMFIAYQNQPFKAS